MTDTDFPTTKASAVARGKEKAKFIKKKKYDQRQKKKDHSFKKHLSTAEANAQEQKDFTHRAKQLWNKILLKDLKDIKERAILVNELFELLKDRIVEVASRHDMCRVLQCCFKYADEGQKDHIVDALKDKIIGLSKGKYSCFLVISLIRYGLKQHRILISDLFRGHIVKLGTHNCGSKVLDYFLRAPDVAGITNAEMTNISNKLFSEFYGNEFAIFGNTTDPAITINKKFKQRKLINIIKELDETKQKSVLANIKAILIKQSDKGMLRYPFCHRLLYEYMQIVDEKAIVEIIPYMLEAILAMTASMEGAKCIVKCIAYSSAKQRKAIVKLLKTHVMPLIQHEYGYLVILACLQFVDDTKLLQNGILSEVIEDGSKLLELVDDEETFGSKVILFLLAPTSKRYFTVAELSLLKYVSVDGQLTSKKDTETRKSELLSYMKESLMNLCVTNINTLITSAKGGDVIVELFRNFPNSPELISSIVNASVPQKLPVILKEDETDEEMEVEQTEVPIFEHVYSHKVLKRCLQIESAMIVTAKAEIEKENCLAMSLYNKNKTTFDTWAIINRPAFVLLALLEHLHTSELVLDEITQDACLKRMKTFKDNTPGTDAVLKLIAERSKVSSATSSKKRKATKQVTKQATPAKQPTPTRRVTRSRSSKK